mgnify:CR=1 FL=1
MTHETATFSQAVTATLTVVSFTGIDASGPFPTDTLMMRARDGETVEAVELLRLAHLDDVGASVVVHGDNGVMLEGKPYDPGAEFRWKPGETLLLGRVATLKAALGSLPAA